MMKRTDSSERGLRRFHRDMARRFNDIEVDPSSRMGVTITESRGGSIMAEYKYKPSTAAEHFEAAGGAYPPPHPPDQLQNGVQRTVSIVDWRNKSRTLIINAKDFDAAKHERAPR